jgi:hypothetical protein
MAATPLRGIDGVFKVKGTTAATLAEVAYADSFTLSGSVDVAEISKLNATAKEFVRGLGAATLSASGTIIWDSSEQRKLINQFMIISTTSSTTSVSVKNLDFSGVLQQGTTVGTTVGGGGLRNDVSIQCEVIPTGFSIEEQAAGSPTWSYDGQVNGNVKYVIRSCTAATEFMA